MSKKTSLITSIVFASLIAVIGIVIFILAIINPSNVTTLISILLAVWFFLVALVALVFAFFRVEGNKKHSLFGSAALLIGLGVLFIVGMNGIMEIFRLLIAVGLIAITAVEIIFISTLIPQQKKKKDHKIPTYCFVLLYILLAALLALGIIFLCMKEENFLRFIYIIVGILLLLGGVAGVVTCAKLLRQKDEDKEEKKEIKEVKEEK